MTRPPEKAHLYDPTGRFYVVPPWVLEQAGKDPNQTVWLPAVSTGLDIYQASSLRSWYGRVGLQEAERVKNQAGTWGSQAHSLIDYLSRGGKIETWDGIDEPVRNSLRAWVRWTIQAKFKPIHAEMIVYSLKWGYAGTLDTVGTFDRDLGIADYKTGKGFLSPLGLLQLAAYDRAFHETYPNHPRIKEARLVGLNRETGDFIERRRTRKELAVDFRYWLAALKLWRYIKADADIEARDIALREKGGINGKEESQGQEATPGQESNGGSQPAAQA